MVDNVDRFKRAEEALEIFVDRIMHGEMNEQGALDLGGVDGFDQDEACCQGDEGGEVPLGLLAA